MISLAFISFSDPTAVVSEVSVGGKHSCALFSNPAGRILCWGNNQGGELGAGNTVPRGTSPGQMTSAPFIVFSNTELATALSAGDDHTCAIFGGRIRCWGQGTNGALGTGGSTNVGNNPTDMSMIVYIPFMDTVLAVQLSAGLSMTCVVFANGKTRCWGLGSNGALGYDSTSNKGNQASGAQAISSVTYHNFGPCGNMASNFGEECDAGTTDPGCPSSTCTVTPGYSCPQVGACTACPAPAISGLTFALSNPYSGRPTGLLVSFSVSSWVDTSATFTLTFPAGSFAIGAASTFSATLGGALPGPLTVSATTGTTVTMTRAGQTSSISSCGGFLQIFLFGTDFRSLLPASPTYSLSLAIAGSVSYPQTSAAAMVSRVEIVVSGSTRTCGIWGGLARCWGEAIDGSLGIGNTANWGDQAGEMSSLVPIPFVLSTLVVDRVAVGYESHSCVLFTTMLGVCFGANTFGQCGAGTTTSPLLGPPPSIPYFNSSPVRQVITPGKSTCVLSDGTGQVTCWGSATGGTLGRGSGVSVHPLTLSSPIVFDQPTITAVQISGVLSHVCALFTNRKVRCWGGNANGELGQGHTRATVGLAPSDMTSIAFISFSDPAALVSSVTTGCHASFGCHSCALFANPVGRIICWGSGSRGRLGIGSLTDRGLAATDMSSLAYITFSSTEVAVSFSAGSTYTCAVFSAASSGGRIRCWGGGFAGKLGKDGVADIGDSPTEMSSLGFIVFSDTIPAVQVSAGFTHTCAVFANERTRCWGEGTFGALGYDSAAGKGHTTGSGSITTVPYHALFPPSISGASLAMPAATVGGQDLTLTGSLFGSVAPGSIAVSVGGTSCLTSTWLSDTTVYCRTPPGVGALRELRVTVNGLASAGIASLFTYAPPTVASLSPAIMPASTAGGQDLTITGTGFGPTGAALAASVSGSACQMTVWISDFSLRCRTPTGAGTLRDVVVTANGQASASNTALFTYAAPTVVGLSLAMPASTAGSEDLTITGTGFGTASTAVTAFVGGTSCLASTWLSPAAVFCKTPPGAGTLRDVAVSVLGLTSGANTALFTYAPPTVTGLSLGMPANSGGGEVLTITGTGFGTAATAVTISIDGFTCSSPTWLSPVSMSCLTPARGPGAGLNVAATVSGQTSPPNGLFSYSATPAPSVVTISLSAPASTLGGEDITITGTNFGATSNPVTVSVGGAACLTSTWLSPTTARCQTPAGAGASLSVLLTTAGQVSNANTLFTYAAPVVTSVSLAMPALTAGSQHMTLSGSHFGPPGTPIVVSVAGASCLTSSWLSTSTVHCETPPGAGAARDLRVTAAGQSSLSNTLLFTYATPLVSSLTPAIMPALTAGGQAVTIVGANYGPSGAAVDAFIGGTACLLSTWISDQMVACITPAGAGNLRDVVVSANGLASPTNGLLFTYEAPTVVSLDLPMPASTAGSQDFTITGTGFGSATHAVAVSISGTACLASTWLSATTVRCKSPAGAGVLRGVVVSALGLSSAPNTALFTYAPPAVAGVSLGSSLLPASTAGSQDITITGTGFGSATHAVTASISGAPCLTSTWISPVALFCKTPPGTGAARDVLATVATQVSAANGIFFYAAPVVTSHSLASASTQGGQDLTVYGSNFGPSGSTAAVSIAGTACLTSAWLSDSSAACKTPPGAGVLYSVEVSVDGQVSLANTLFSYAAPVVTSISPSSPSFSTLGGADVTLGGSNFGPSAASFTSVRVSGTACLTSAWLSDGAAYCLTPPGTGALRDLRVSVGGQASAANTALFSYAAPSVTALSLVTPALRSGGEAMTIIGSGFGPGLGTLAASVSGVACLTSYWISDSEAHCDTPAGAGTGLNVAVVVDGQASLPANALFSYVVILPAVSGVSLPMPALRGGGQAMTVTGSNFGATSGPVAVSVGGAPCLNSTWLSNSTIFCVTPPGTTLLASVTVTAGGLTSAPATSVFSYLQLPGTLVSVSPPGAPALSGSTVVTLVGSSTLAQSTGDITQITLAGIACSGAALINSTAVTCTAGLSPAGATSGPVAIATTSSGASPGMLSFAFRSASVLSVTPSAAPLSGATQITLAGSSFVSIGNVTEILLAGVNCSSVTVVSDSTLTCTSGAVSNATSGPVTLRTSLGGPASSAATFSYIVPPTVTAVTPSTGLASGGYAVLISGTGFGTSAATVLVRIGSSACSAIVALTPTSLNCTVGSGTAGPAAVTVTVSGVPSAGPAPLFTFFSNGTGAPTPAPSLAPSATPVVTPPPPPPPNSTTGSGPPYIAIVTPSTGSVLGGTVVTLVGFYLGRDAIDCAAVLAGATPCAAVVWASSTSVLCTTPVSSFAGPVVMAVRTRSGGQSPTGPTFRFAPHVLGASPRDLRYAGGDVITILGRGFGPFASVPPTSVAIEGVPCAPTTYISDTMLVCTTPSFASVGVSAPSLSVVMAAALASTTLSPAQARLNYRSSATWNFCSPPCGFPGDCSGGAVPSCVCQRGFSSPPACATQLLAVTVTRSLVVEGGAEGLLGVDYGGAGVPPTSPVSISKVDISTPKVIWGGGPAGTGPVGPTRSPALIRLVSSPDQLRMAPAPFSVTVTTSSADPLFNGITLEPVTLMLNDSTPTIISVSPKAVPLAGGTTLTVFGAHFDQAVQVSIDGLLCNVTRMTTQSNVTLSQRVGLQAAAASDPSLEEVHTFEISTPPVATGRAEAYAVLAVHNSLSQTATSSGTVVFYTDLCPKPGQLGKGLSCRDCPRGAECPGGERIWPLPGFWSPSEGSGFVVECSPPESCKGYEASGKNHTAQCSAGYSGDRCGQCAQGFYRSADNCVPCPASASRLAFILADVVVWGSFGLAGTLIKNRVALSYLFIAMKSLQSLAGVGAMASNNMPRWIVLTYEFLHLFSGDYSFVKAECGKPVPYSSTFFAGLAYTVALIAPLLITITLLAAVLRDETKRVFYRDRLTRCVQIALIFWYLPMTTSSLATLSCVPNSDGSKYFMITHPNEQCYTAEKMPAVIVSCLLLLFLTLLFPVLTMAFLKSEANKEKLLQDEMFKARWDIYYEFLNTRSPYFWIIDYPILFVVALGKSTLRPHINYQMSISVVVFSIKVLFIIIRRPFIDWLTDVIQGVMAVVSLIMININFFVRHRVTGYKTIATSLFAVSMAGTVGPIIALTVLAIIAAKTTQVVVVHVKEVVNQAKEQENEGAEREAEQLAKTLVTEETERQAAGAPPQEQDSREPGVFEVMSARVTAAFHDIFGSKEENMGLAEEGPPRGDGDTVVADESQIQPVV